MNITITAGQTVALVGASGNGKTTCLQLLQRFYDTDDGYIAIDDCDIKNMNIYLLRSNIALVGQEPVLFSTSICDNIRYGKPEATQKEIIAAAQDSGAHDFIIKLPEGYNTLVGEKGCQLSGGQKQRIAIARALIQNPKILLLDEATSALDYHSEKIVQETLNRASKGRTTIVVSHRLSVIRNADRIVFIDKGQVVEDGNHFELLELKGRYYEMVTAGNLEDDASEYSIPMIATVNENHENQEKINGKQLFLDRQQSHQDYQVKDTTSTDSDGMEQDNKLRERANYWATFKRIVKLAKPEWLHLFIAFLSSVAIGASFPIFAILFGDFYGVSSWINISFTKLRIQICQSTGLVADRPTRGVPYHIHTVRIILGDRLCHAFSFNFSNLLVQYGRCLSNNSIAVKYN